MLQNKSQQQPHSRSHTFSISNYLVEFSYRSRSKPKQRSMLNHNIEGQLSTRKKYSDQITREQVPSVSNSISYAPLQRKKQKIGSFLTEGCQPAITQAFPSRKVKTNEHQLFKILAKLEYHQGQKKRNDCLFQRKLSLVETSPRNRNKSPNRPPPHLCKWDKQRYCANRDKDNGKFPAAFFRSVSNPLQTSIKVKNPVRK